MPAAAFSVATHVSVPALVIDPFAQLNPLSTGCPVPLRLTVKVVPVDELLVSVTVPLTAPAAFGAKLTVSVAVLSESSVNGKLTPEIVYPVPLTVPALTVTAAVPDEVNVTDPVPVAPTATVPRLTLVGLSVSVDTAAPRLIPQVSVPPPDDAVNVAVCAAATADIVAVKLPVVAPAATVTDDGTTTAVLSLERLTV